MDKRNPSEFPNSSFGNYMSELAAEIIENGNPHGDLFEEMQAAHARRQAVAADMAAGKSVRAIAARHMIAARIWHNVRGQQAAQSVMFEVAQAVQA